MNQEIVTIYEVWGVVSEGGEPSRRHRTGDIFEAYRRVEEWLKYDSPNMPAKVPGEAEAWIDKVEEFADGEEISRYTIRRAVLKSSGKTELVPV